MVCKVVYHRTPGRGDHLANIENSPDKILILDTKSLLPLTYLQLYSSARRLTGTGGGDPREREASAGSVVASA